MSMSFAPLERVEQDGREALWVVASRQVLVLGALVLDRDSTSGIPSSPAVRRFECNAANACLELRDVLQAV